MHFHTVPVVLSCLLLEALPAQQDMLGVTFDGLAIAFDSHTGVGVSIGPTNPALNLNGHNAMARLGNDLWSTDRTPLGTGFRYNLDRIDRATGFGSRIAVDVGDLRGLAAHPSAANTVNVTGTLPASFLIASSSGHTPGRLGVFVLGFSNQQAQGQTLPFLLDPMFGTLGCRLYTSIDLTFVAVVATSGNCNSQVGLPAAAAGLTLFAQQMVLEPTLPGGMSWSHGVMVKVGF